MRRSKRLAALGLCALAGAIGCGGEDTRSSAGGKSTNEPVIDIAVDANRDGVVKLDDTEDQDFEEAWDATHGASFLANLDDDDQDGVRDGDDDVVNGDADAADLARILVNAWPDAPTGATGTLTIDAASAPNVRVFKKNPDGSWLAVGGGLACTAPDACNVVPAVTLLRDELRAGVELGIEGRRFRISEDAAAWNGMVDLSFSITDAAGALVKSSTEPTGIDHAKIRVAPWVLFGNLSPFDNVWADPGSAPFVAGITKATTDAGIQFSKVTTWDDQWTQDFFQTAWTAMPGPDGKVQGMRIANPRPWGRDNGSQWLPIHWLMTHYLGPDRGVVQIYKVANTGDSYDSHGNHDLLPPYKNGTSDFPLGRIIHGSGILPETKEFYAAQEVQGPPFTVDTTWLLVGHVDEFFSYVPAKTARGWKLFVGSPKLAKSMLEKAQADGFGSTPMFVNKKAWDDNGNYINAQVTIDQVLADVDIMQWSQEAQGHIDTALAATKAEVGLADDEVIEIPFLFHVEYGGLVAYQPGTVNQLVFGDYALMPKPFGPNINGTDLFEKDLQDRIATPNSALGAAGQGMKLYFIDDWYTYHINEGEVHCGSNPEAPAPFANVKWWETGR